MALKIAAFECYPTTQRGGSEKAFFEVLVGLSQLNFNIILFYNIEGDLVAKYEELGIKCIQIPSLKIAYLNPKNWYRLFLIGKKISQQQPDIIYINQLADSPIAAITKLFLKRVKTVCHLRVAKTGESKIFNLCGRFIDLFITVNKLIKAEYQDIFIGQKIEIVNDGILIPEKVYTLKKNPRFNVVYLGRISKEKGILELINTWKILLKQYELEINLSITGPAVSENEIEFKKEVQIQINHAGLSHLIHLNHPIDDVINYLSNFDFLVFPSTINESFGRTIPESILAGVPVFARNIGIVSEILAPEKEKLIFNTEEELAFQIKEFYSKGLSINIEALQQHIIQHYDVQKNVLLISKNLAKVALA